MGGSSLLNKEEYMTFDNLLSKTKLTEAELKEHLVTLSIRYLGYLGVLDAEKGLVQDCTKFYTRFYKEGVCTSQ